MTGAWFMTSLTLVGAPRTVAASRSSALAYSAATRSAGCTAYQPPVGGAPGAYGEQAGGRAVPVRGSEPGDGRVGRIAVPAVGDGSDNLGGLGSGSTTQPRHHRKRLRVRRCRRPVLKTFGFHPLLAYLDRPEVAGGEALAGLLRPGNAGSNTAADHVTVIDMALAALPAAARPRPNDPPGPTVLVRTDAAGATHGFAAALRQRGCGFSVGFAVDQPVQAAVLAVPAAGWTPAYDIDGDLRDGAWIAEITDCVDLTAWPEGSRLIVRRERPHPGARSAGSPRARR